MDIGNQQCWEMLGEAALKSLDVDFAIRVYRQLQDAGMVLGLQKLRFACLVDKNKVVLLYTFYTDKRSVDYFTLKKRFRF